MDNKISLDLDETIRGKIDAALQKPTGLTKTKLVGVGTQGQENIEIGDNLTLQDGKLAAAGSGISVIELTDKNGTIASAQLGEINANPQNFSFKYNGNILLLTRADSTTYQYCNNTISSSENSVMTTSTLLTITSRTGVYTIAEKVHNIVANSIHPANGGDLTNIQVGSKVYSIPSGGGEQPKLAAPTIAKTNGTMTITTPSSNGDFDTTNNIYNGATLYKTFPTTGSWSMENNTTLNETYMFSASLSGKNFVESDKSNSFTWGKYQYDILIPNTLKCSVQTSSTKYYGEKLEATISASGEEVELAAANKLTVTNPSSSSYTFVKTDSGYYESNNKGKASTYAYARFSFTLASNSSNVIVSYVNSGESNFDYGTISKLDTDLSQSTNDDSNILYAGFFKGQSSTDTKRVELGPCSAGTHYFTVKFRKDGSGDNGNDSLRIMRIAYEKPAVGIYLDGSASCNMENESLPNYSWNPYTGKLVVKKIVGKFSVSISTTDKKLLDAPVAKLSGSVLSWGAIEGAVSYTITWQGKKSGVAKKRTVASDVLSFDLSPVITDKDLYTVRVRADADTAINSNSTPSNTVTYSKETLIYGVVFSGNALEGTRIGACEGVTNDDVEIGYFGETLKASNWFDDKDPWKFEIVHLTMRDASGTALVDKDTGREIKAPFVKRKNFYVRIRDAEDGTDGQIWEVATGPSEGFTPIYTAFDGTIPEYFYQPCYPFVQLNTASGTYYGAQRWRKAVVNHNFNSADHYSKCAYVGNEDGLALQPLITMRKCIYDANLPLFLIEFACRNSQRFFNCSYQYYGSSEYIGSGSARNYIGVLDSVESSSATYTQIEPYKDAATNTTPAQVYKYRGQECCFNCYYWVVGDMAFGHSIYYKCDDVSKLTSYSNWPTIACVNAGGKVAAKMKIDSGSIHMSVESSTATYNSVYYCDKVFSHGSYPLILLGGGGDSGDGAFHVGGYSWDGADSDTASRPCLSAV